MEVFAKRLDESNAALHVMVLYDGLNAGVLGKHIYDVIWGRLPRGAGARLSLWRFDAVRNRRTERLAYRDLTEAHVLTVAADGSRPLPPEVRKTLRTWFVTKRPARIGLLGILHGVEEQEKELSPVHSFLDGLAKQAKTDFFAQAIAHTAQNGESTFISARRPLTLDFVWDEDSSVGSIVSEISPECQQSARGM